jgi:hypothetical protein
MAKAEKTGGENARVELDRLGRAGETLGGGAVREPSLATEGDGIEVWGRRVGKLLGWAFVMFLLVQLLRTYAG